MPRRIRRSCHAEHGQNRCGNIHRLRRRGGTFTMNLAQDGRLFVHSSRAIRLHALHGRHLRNVLHTGVGRHRELGPSQHRDTENREPMAYFSCQHVLKLGETGAEVKNILLTIMALNAFVMCAHIVLLVYSLSEIQPSACSRSAIRS